MDHRNFDRLAREAAATPSRRAMVRLLAAGVAGGALARLGLGAAEAQVDVEAQGSRGVGERCNRTRQCQRGLKCCGRRCRDVLTDRSRCGNCNRTCDRDTQVCRNGRCFDTCRGAQPGVCDTRACAPLCGCNALADTGEGVCEDTGIRCSAARSCTTDANCDRGEACVDEGCCAGKPRICARPCGSRSVEPAATEATRGSRPE